MSIDHTATQTTQTPRAAGSRERTKLGSPVYLAGIAAVLFNGAIFGFFFAWACSTLWGLDNADPRVAIEAMQEMNAIVRNPVFAPAFFGTTFVLLLAGLVARSDDRSRASRFFLGASLLYFLGGFLLTATINVPMNKDLADVIIPESVDAAEAIWMDYSEDWKLYNGIRTIVSGITLGLAALGLATLSDKD